MGALLILDACSMRMDWPDHRVKVSISSSQTQKNVMIDGFELGLVGVTLKPCRQWSLMNLFISEAYAHSIESPDYLAVNALYSGESLSLGTMRPFEGDYCSVVLQVAPLTPGGASVHVWGTQDNQPIDVRDTRRLELDLALNESGFAGSERHLDINLDFDPSSWVAPSTMQSDDPGLEILLKIKETTRWEIQGD